MVRIDSGLGPSIPFVLVEEVYTQKCNSLNLHANKIKRLETHADEKQKNLHSYLDTLQDLDVSSNALGQQSIPITRSNERLPSPISVLSIAQNLESINLSANGLTSLSRVFSNGNKILELPQLKKLILSHNRLKTVPNTLFQVCPRLEILCLVANNIRNLNDLLSPFQQQKESHLLNLLLQNKDGSNQNPVCHDKKYRAALILVLPRIAVLDEVKIIRHENSCYSEMEAHTSTIDNDDIVRADFRPRKVDANRYTNPKRRSYTERTGSETMKSAKTETCNNHQEERQIRIQRAASRGSLHKLNQIEHQVKALSLIAQEQAQATKELLRKNDERIVCTTESQAQTISEEHVCTSPMSSPPPTKSLTLSKGTLPNIKCRYQAALAILSLQVAVLKWKLFAMAKGLFEQHQASINATTVARKELLATREDLEWRHKSGDQTQQLALAQKDHEICLLQTELSSLKAKFRKVKLKARRKIEHLAQIADSELEAAHNGYQTRLERDQATFMKSKEQLQGVYHCCHDLETQKKGLTDALDAEKKQAKELTAQLQGHLSACVIERDKAELNYSKVSSSLISAILLFISIPLLMLVHLKHISFSTLSEHRRIKVRL